MKLLNPKKTKLAPDTIGSKFMAWSPILGIHDVRWASELPPFGPFNNNKPIVNDVDLDYDLDKEFEAL